MGGSFRQAPNEPGQRLLRAIDIRTGTVAWEVPQTGNVNSGEPAMEGVADDLRVRQPAVRGCCVGVNDHRIRFALAKLPIIPSGSSALPS